MRLIAHESPDGPLMARVENDLAMPLMPVDDFYADVPAGLAAEPGTGARLADLVQVAPVPATSRVICVALNYPLHIEETSKAKPEHPNLFARWASTLAVHGSTTVVPPGDIGLDWEAELAVIIGSEMAAVAESAAMQGVFGYTCFNDISARGLQAATSQWALGKNTDSSGPIGPAIVTADEVGDPYALRIGSRLNGQTMQDSVTGNMIFGIAETIAYISQAMTLLPGDVIATGTPDGVGAWREPPVFMTAGDVIEVEIEGIGVLTTHIG